jgi:hypothetical protein
MSHLTPDELIDALDAALAPARRAHLDTCDACRREATALHALLGDVRAAEVPEPSPLFWDHLSARIRTSVASERPPAAATRWFHWPVLAPIAGLALIVVALVATMPSDATVQPAAAVSTDVAPEEIVADGEVEWAVLADLVGEFDLDSVHEAGIDTGPGAADTAIMQLTPVERQELMRLLREELRAGG